MVTVTLEAAEGLDPERGQGVRTGRKLENWVIGSAYTAGSMRILGCSS